ncbi:hypothetical protein C8Q73DRAFT_823761 [Cubamyces lactineus]|nr:hypothetical protein C8Q73DRAFT_823761 [Cubamyces lactineus]
MGQGGYLTIYNATQYNWRKTYQHSYQMNDWNFPATIAAFSSASIYVEFDESIGKDTGDDAGEATFEIVGAPAGQAQFQFAVKFRDLFTRLLEFPAVAAGSNVIWKTLPRGILRNPRNPLESIGFRHSRYWPLQNPVHYAKFW